MNDSTKLNPCGYSDKWQPYIGDYSKHEFDIILNDGREIWNCYPNARKFGALGGPNDGQSFHEDLVAEIRFSQRPILGMNFDVSNVTQSWEREAWVPVPESGLVFTDKLKDTEHFAGLGTVATNVLYDFELAGGRVLERVVNREYWMFIDTGIPVDVVSLTQLKRVRLSVKVEQTMKSVGGVVMPDTEVIKEPKPFTSPKNPYAGKSGRRKGKKANLGSTAVIVHDGSSTLIKNKSTGRNEPCPCSSGKKFKKCCINK